MNPGPDPNKGIKNVKAITTIRGGVILKILAKINTGVLNFRESPSVIFQVTYVVSNPEIKKNVSTDIVPLKIQ